MTLLFIEAMLKLLTALWFLFSSLFLNLFYFSLLPFLLTNFNVFFLDIFLLVLPCAWIVLYKYFFMYLFFFLYWTYHKHTKAHRGEKNISNIIQYRNLSEEKNKIKNKTEKGGTLQSIHAKNTYFPITWRDHENTNRKKEARPWNKGKWC